jgi:hypothetical protein
VDEAGSARESFEQESSALETIGARFPSERLDGKISGIAGTYPLLSFLSNPIPAHLQSRAIPK